MVAGGVLSNIGTYVSYLQTSSTSLREMARDGKAPWIFRWPRSFKQPVMGMIFYSITTSVLINFEFSTLVEMETLLYCLHIIIVSLGIVKLRYSGELIGDFFAFLPYLLVFSVADRDIHRPFKIPGGIVGAALVALLPTGVSVANLVIFFNAPEDQLAWWKKILGFVFIAAGGVLYLLTKLYRRWKDKRTINKRTPSPAAEVPLG
jgi:amino acid transporter